MTARKGKKLVISDADAAAAIVLDQAMMAAAQGTFPVGGCLVENATGRLIHAMHNNVLKPLQSTGKPFTYDPTAHGERQLAYWYYDNKENLNLPEPGELTVVTTLDPCAMCTGTLLAAGFNVAVVAIDDFAGINYDSSFTFKSLPAKLSALAKDKFGYFACGHKDRDPKPYVRDYVGGQMVAFKGTTVGAQRLMGCGSIFQANVNAVRQNSTDVGRTPDKLQNPADLPEDSPIKVRYRKIFPGALKTKMPTGRLPNAELHQLLVEIKDSAPKARNAVALLDPFGNVILCLPDTLEKSPVHTAFMNVTRSYATTRFGLMNDEATRPDAEAYLTHPKYGTFVFLHAPDPAEATTIMTLGAYGSTMEGPVPQTFPANLQYFEAPIDGTVAELRSVIMNLPPFYTTLVQISAMEVAT